MIEIKDKNIIIDGKPQMIMCAEMHYYRTDPKDWQDRIDKIKAAGFNAIASYIPWLCHEEEKGQYDFDGHKNPLLNVKGFIDLCEQNGLKFFTRPGPFVMAEMKNEGLPFWLLDENPQINAISWDGVQTDNATVNYLDPIFLREARRWYEAVMKEVIVPRLHDNGGNIIGIQLDNEIGMLNMVTKRPDLSDGTLDDFRTWLKGNYNSAELARRYPFKLDDDAEMRMKLRSPENNYSGAFLNDYGHFVRGRFAEYVAVLRGYAEDCGVAGVPYFINLHGGSNPGYPVGISQLYKTYTQSEGYVAGSDYYFRNLDMDTFQDIHLCNSFLLASQRPEQPLTSLEFSCGDGNYGNTFSGRVNVSASDLKTRLMVAQGARMLNFYTFCGGHNYRLDNKPGDGNDRIARTGERHGFAAPIGPNGELNYTYDRLSHIVNLMQANADKLADMYEEHDNVAVAFIPDYFMTETRQPGNETMNTILSNLESRRSGNFWHVVARSMLLNGYRFGAINVQDNDLDPEKTPVLAMASARYMDKDLQEKLSSWLQKGGRLMVYGELPQFDMEGNPCTVLCDAMGVKQKNFEDSSHKYTLFVGAEGWAAPKVEHHAYFAQVFEENGVAEPLLRTYGKKGMCGFDTPVGKGRAIVIATTTPCDRDFMDFYATALEKLGASAALRHDCEQHGIFMTSTANDRGERFLHIINLDDFEKKLHIFEKGQPLLGGRDVELGARDGMMLPLSMTFNRVSIIHSTAEVSRVGANEIEFRLTQPRDEIVLKTDRKVLPDRDYDVKLKNGRIKIVSNVHAKIDNKLVVRFGS